MRRACSLRFVFSFSSVRCQNKWDVQDHPVGCDTRPYWAWEPSKCSLDPVNKDKFCKVMEGRKGVLLVGESSRTSPQGRSEHSIYKLGTSEKKKTANAPVASLKRAIVRQGASSSFLAAYTQSRHRAPCRGQSDAPCDNNTGLHPAR